MTGLDEMFRISKIMSQIGLGVVLIILGIIVWVINKQVKR